MGAERGCFFSGQKEDLSKLSRWIPRRICRVLRGRARPACDDSATLPRKKTSPFGATRLGSALCGRAPNFVPLTSNHQPSCRTSQTVNRQLNHRADVPRSRRGGSFPAPVAHSSACRPLSLERRPPSYVVAPPSTPHCRRKSARLRQS